jgi:hypothetical protein
MAKVIESDTVLTLKLAFWEKLLGFKSGISVSKDLLVGRSTVSNPWRSDVIKGFRAPGTAFPFLILLGTMRYRGGKDFTAIYKNHPVEILEFKDSPYKRWIIAKE